MFNFPAKLIRQTDTDFLLDVGTKTWFPKHYTRDNGDGTFTCPGWLAFEKEIV